MAETEVGELALDEVDQAGVRVLQTWVLRFRRGAAVLGGEPGEGQMLVFEVAQDVLQPFLDAAEIVGAGIVRCLQPLEQIRYALFEMGESRRIIVADLQAVDAIG